MAVRKAATIGAQEERVLRVWDLETGEARVFDLPEPKIESNGSDAAGEWVWHLAFTGESTLLTTIVQDDPIHVYVNVNERDLLQFSKSGRELPIWHR